MVSDRTKLTSSTGVASAERRRHSRFAFSAAAEVVEIGSSARIQGRISDLARGGCYVDVISPFAVGSEVTIRIVVDSRTLTAEARVVFAAPGMGMGLMFTSVEPAQSPVLESWLADLSGEARPESPTARAERPSEKPPVREAPRHEESYVLNELIIALMRKQVLSDAEGKALLQKLMQ